MMMHQFLKTADQTYIMDVRQSYSKMKYIKTGPGGPQSKMKFMKSKGANGKRPASAGPTGRQGGNRELSGSGDVRQLQQALLHDVMAHARINPDKVGEIYGHDSRVYQELMEELDFLSKIDGIGALVSTAKTINTGAQPAGNHNVQKEKRESTGIVRAFKLFRAEIY